MSEGIWFLIFFCLISLNCTNSKKTSCDILPNYTSDCIILSDVYNVYHSEVSIRTIPSLDYILVHHMLREVQRGLTE